MKRALAILTAMTIMSISLASCGQDSSSAVGDSTAGSSLADVSDSTTTTTTTTTTAQTSQLPDETTSVTEGPDEPIVEITTSEEKEIVPQTPEYTEFEKIVEAQDGDYSGEQKEDSKREGASDKKYLTGFKNPETDGWSAKVELPTDQYYNILFVMASGKDKPKTNIVVVDGEQYGEITTDKSGKFQALGFDNVWLAKGEHTIALEIKDGGIDFDYMVVSSSSTVSDLDLTYKTLPALSNKNADFKTRAIYEYLSKNYGKTIVSGQYATIGTNAELEAIYQTTGHYPAIRLGDMISYTSEDTIAADIEIAQQWGEKGGLVSYMWHWADPMNEQYYAKDTDFDVAKAVAPAELKVAQLSYDELQKLYDEGKISGECLTLIRDIDIISEQFKKLQESGITILWRPLHEAGGGWFWWGKDVKSYKWLWTLLYDRMTTYHKLNNLIWVWNGQNPDWYVGDKYCDMISADIYDEAGASQLSAFLSLRRINVNKPLVLSECGRAPDIQKLADEKTMWSWFGIWSGAYVIDSFGAYSEEYITKDEMITLYSNNLVICLDKLPDFDELAKELEEAQKKPEEEKPSEDKPSEDKPSEDKKSDDSSEKTE